MFGSEWGSRLPLESGLFCHLHVPVHHVTSLGVPVPGAASSEYVPCSFILLSVTSSEKVDKAQRYADFTLLSIPYPGTGLMAEGAAGDGEILVCGGQRLGLPACSLVSGAGSSLGQQEHVQVSRRGLEDVSQHQAA